MKKHNLNLIVYELEEIAENRWEDLKSRLDTKNRKLPFIQIYRDVNPIKRNYWAIERG